MICQIPQKAAIIAIPPRPSKKVKMSNNPKPEFWIPVSIANVFLFLNESLNKYAIVKPSKMAIKLWEIPMAKHDEYSHKKYRDY